MSINNNPLLSRLVSIDSNNVDFYRWGNNCRKLRFNEGEAAIALVGERIVSPEQADLFWTGFLYGKD